MIEVVIDSVRVSLMSQHRVVILKEMHSERFLPILIGTCETDAIMIKLQDGASTRPLTHDLLKTVIEELGGRVVHIFVNDLKNDVFYARILVEINGREIDIDSRPSDAIALAVRTNAPIFVAEAVLEKAGTLPDPDVLLEEEAASEDPNTALPKAKRDKLDEGRLSAFANFLDTLDLDSLGNEDEE